jgi:transposase-like protein
VKKITYKYLRAERQPGELVEIDVKYVPGMIADKRYYQYTAIDTASRWRYLRVFEEQTTYHTILFLEDVIARFSTPYHGSEDRQWQYFHQLLCGYQQAL